MKKYRNIYVAATSQHIGKTTTTLGLISALHEQGVNVGYCKPVGQQYINIQNHKVDKDTILFADLLGFDIEPEIHSPIIFSRGTTEHLIENRHDLGLDPVLIAAAKELNNRHELTIFEGTGHPGVGTIANLSNARVAKILDAGVIMVVEGGIGRTIDMLHMSTALFREEGVPLIGVIVNKVWEDKADKIRHYLSLFMNDHNIPLLGILPYDKTLAYPLVRTVCAAIKGDVIKHEENLNNKVSNILGGSIIDLNEFKASEDMLLVASARLADRAISKVISFSSLMDLEDSPLSGIVITGSEALTDDSNNYIDRYKIPLIRTKLDTYGVTVKISRVEVKINRRTPWKVRRAIELVQQNVDLDKIIQTVREY